ncbi:MAG: DNA mismatch repair protein MutS [Clostridia bacterium]|nr:DNA mismatch repair protein MutS [Clostridia bacterium]
MAEYTPMMKQYLSVKENYKDTILFYRLGDFYEMFFDDAKLCANVLDLVLTGRDCGQEERAPMCGVPFHSVDPYIARLVSRGYKVAICEQVEDPKTAKGLVKRDVIRIITPGTVIESSMLDETKNNYLCCVYHSEGKTGICFADVSTGEVQVTELEESIAGERVINELGRFSPREVLANAQAAKLKGLRSYLDKTEGISLEVLPDSKFTLDYAELTVTQHFGKSVEELELKSDNVVRAAAATLDYLRLVQKTDLSNIREINFYSENKYMKLDFAARRNLELTETMRNREKRGTLLWVLDKTRTAMGKRLLRSFIEQPLVSAGAITQRQNAVAYLIENMMLRDEIAEYLSSIHDMERLITRISYGSANARELVSLSKAAEMLAPIKALLAEPSTALLESIENDIDTLDDISELIDKAIVDDPPFSIREGGFIREGYSAEVDELNELITNAKGYLAKIEQDEREKTGIPKLKIGYNRVFGYYIEVSNSYKELVPEHYIRKQTLTNGERFITSELKELETKVLGAQERITKLEYELFCQIREVVSEALVRIQKTSRAVAYLDVLCSFAKVAVENNYICPVISDDGVISITEGRHPVVEKMLDGAPFVPNDTSLDLDDNQAAIITGPNMAGKSTYMRQVALIVLMAQIGSFVPARDAKISICDSIFTRVGASDDLASGQSTFMVEMNEVANILKNATKDSLIILDEIGRGTSTFDGMSIAKAVLEYVCNKRKLGAKTLFATHYHELTEMEGEVPGVKNYNIACKKRGDDIIFLRRIVRGPADGSYGIEVAKLAGVPNVVVKRAREVLEEILESQGAPIVPRAAEPVAEEAAPEMQLSLTGGRTEEFIEELKNLDVNTFTPIEAMNYLYELNKKAKEL